MRGMALALTITALVAPAAAAQDSLPPGVTQQVVSDGEKIYKGAGLCYACHGPDAKGIQNLGPNLADSVWLHSKGTFDDIVKQITTGVTGAQSKSGAVMPPNGGAPLSDAQVRAVAAYVWRLSHQ
ncbi:MAG: c-type cytochrome [Gemmatimonadales bacterium]